MGAHDAPAFPAPSSFWAMVPVKTRTLRAAGASLSCPDLIRLDPGIHQSSPENQQFAFLPKPFTLNRLVAAVKETMAPS
jgi:hypothetical protein